MKKLTLGEAIGFLSATQQGNGVAVMHGKKVRRKVMYIAGLANTIPATNDLIEPKTNKEIGITNFDKGNVLNGSRHLLVVGVRALFDTTTDVTPKIATWKSEAPAVFKNGELLITQDGSGDLLNTPIGPICKYNAAIATEDEFVSVVPFLIRPNVPFYIRTLLAGTVSTNQAYKLELDCVELVDADAS